MPLDEYRRKRDFKKTSEPSGTRARSKSKALRFVVQMHDATRLHYDFRLETEEGVLASWAVPKGPTQAAGDRRLAMHVEDHPLDYRDFEGVIPKGEYGGGPVIVWDRGTYALFEGTSASREIALGKIKFVLNGKKLKGLFSLVKIKPREGESGEPWLLIKDKDEYVDPKYDVKDHPESVKSGKTIAEVARNPHSETWHSNKPARGGSPIKAAPAAKRDPMPKPKSLMLATLVDEPFDDDDWLFELKWDGYRALCSIDERGKLALTSRNGKDLLATFPELGDLSCAFASLPIEVDGEIVSLDSQGRPQFQNLQYHAKSNEPLHYACFDVLYADGRDLRKTPLERRKATLERLIGDDGIAFYSKHVVGKGRALFAKAQQSGLEGIIGKKRDSTYQERRSRDWVKIKARLEQEFVIGGWTEPRGSRKGFGALLMGVYEGKSLRYCGSVGTGFTENALRDLLARLKKIERKTSPFVNEVTTTEAAHWVVPELVAQVHFAEWTRDGYLRQPAYLGLRLDKAAKEVVLEKAVADPPQDGAPKKNPREKAVPQSHAAPDDPPPKASGARVGVEVGGRKLSFSNLDKVLWPRDGYTKGDLIAYYRAVAKWAVPHLSGRPLTLERYPNGIDGGSFFEKQIPKGTPDWVHRVTISKPEGRRAQVTYVVCDDEPTLAYLGNLASIILHAWTSRVGSLDEPDFVIFDLDPGEACTLKTLAKVALELRDLLESLGLAPLVKTSGGMGLHVVVPLARGHAYEAAKVFAELVAHRLSDTLGRDYISLERSVAKRNDAAVYFDYVQVGRGKTIVSAYSARARDGAPVSMPLRWAEVEAYARRRTAVPADAFAEHNIGNAVARLEETGDLWSGKAWKPAQLDRALARARKAWR
ncbi:MAG: DNA ligase D [Vulcanimicrobiaceae bacterium]